MVCTSTVSCFLKSTSIPARSISSANSGISNRSELNPAKSEPLIISLTCLLNCLKVGSLATFSSVIPCTAVVCGGMGISGFTNHVFASLLPFGKTFKIEISTMRSFATFTPVVSKSKKHKGRVNESSILQCLRVVPVLDTFF